MASRDIVSLARSLVSLIVGLFFAYMGYAFFNASVAWLAAEPPRVLAGLMAGLAGFTSTAAAVTLLRDWLVLEKLEKRTSSGETEAQQKGRKQGIGAG